MRPALGVWDVKSWGRQDIIFFEAAVGGIQKLSHLSQVGCMNAYLPAVQNRLKRTHHQDCLDISTVSLLLLGLQGTLKK